MLLRRTALLAGVLVGCSWLSAGCTGGGSGATGGAGSTTAVSATAPASGQCRPLTATDLAQPSNDDPALACSATHTAQTYAAGRLPARLVRGIDAAHVEDAATGRSLGGFAYRTCDRRFARFVGATQSLVLRTTLSWAWFRPTAAQWRAGARWWRCDVVARDDGELMTLPSSAHGLLLGRPADQWLLCARGPAVTGSAKVPCSTPHTWRAVTTIVVGGPGERYPGTRVVASRTRAYCSDSVGAWLGYPADYDVGYTWFHRAEWRAGNRRSICWARTSR